MTYCFRCLACGYTAEVIRPMAECSNPEPCICGDEMCRDLRAEHSSVRADYSRPIVSESMAFDACDIAEHRRQFPDVEVKVDGRIANPVLRNLTQKRAYLKGRGFLDQNSFI